MSTVLCFVMWLDVSMDNELEGLWKRALALKSSEEGHENLAWPILRPIYMCVCVCIYIYIY